MPLIEAVELTPADLLAVIEQADEGDRFIDLSLLCWRTGENWYWIDQTEELVTCDRFGEGSPRNPVVRLTRYSRDMQAAFDLLPDGFSFEIIGAKPDGTDAAVLLWKEGLPAGNRVISGQGRTVALAMCSASVRVSLPE